MKKLMTAMLGLALLTGATVVVNAQDTTKTTKTKKTKKTKAKKTDTTVTK